MIIGAKFDEDLAFVVEACGFTWSVHRFRKDGKRGMIAFTKNELVGTWIIGMIKPGELTPEQVIAELTEGHRKESN